jgi:mRNA interferase RelE/StbE
MYNIIIKKSALKELRDIPKVFRLDIINKIDELALNPRPAGVKKLENERDNYRIRIGDFRVVYQIQDKKLIVEVVKVAHRREVYKNK